MAIFGRCVIHVLGSLLLIFHATPLNLDSDLLLVSVASLFQNANIFNIFGEDFGALLLSLYNRDIKRNNSYGYDGDDSCLFFIILCAFLFPFP